MNILQVSTYDHGGGAERVAWGLFSAYRQRGHESRLAVGFRSGNDPSVFQIPNAGASRGWPAFWWRCREQAQSRQGRLPGMRRLAAVSHRLAAPISWVEYLRGIEDFHYPGTRALLRSGSRPLDILHCHNLHGDYFDLGALPFLSQHVPLILTLHDAWLLSGHCAHSLACQRWQTGCGACPDLTLYPAVRQDNTARNWQTKRAIYRDSRLYVATPSQWLLDKLQPSILAPAVAGSRVIPNGIDLSTFRPGDKHAARAALRLPQEARLLLFTANRAKRNSYKDISTVRSAIETVAKSLPDRRLLLVALGSGPAIEIRGAEARCIPFLNDPALVARYYQSADVYVHAARADTFPQVVLEAMACGTPVVATAVGGILEQVIDGESGLLTPPGDPAAMAAALARLITDDALRGALASQAVARARRCYDLERQTDDYLDFYQWALDDFAKRPEVLRDA